MRYEWEEQVSSSVLESGFKLYRSGWTKKIKKIKNGYELRNNSYSYTKIEFRGKQICVDCRNGDCYYRYYAENHICSHAVAMLYHHEGLEVKEEQSGKNVPLFTEKSDEYAYFDFKNMVSPFRVDSIKLEKAKKLIAEGKVAVYRFRHCYNAYNETEKGGFASVRFLDENGNFDHSVIVEFLKRKILRIKCEARYCYFEYEAPFEERYYSSSRVPELNNPKSLCVHSIAALLVVKEYAETQEPTDATSTKATKLLRFFRNQKMAASGEKVKNVHLEPELQNDDGELSVAFKVGTDKLFKIKNLGSLVDAYENEETLELSKKALLQFSMQDFDEMSQKYFSLIQNEINNIRQRNEKQKARIRWGYSTYVEERVGQTLSLHGSLIDEFYDLAKEDHGTIHNVEKIYGKQNSKNIIPLQEEKPSIRLKLDEFYDERKNLEGIVLSGRMPSLIQGVSYAYFADNEGFYRLPEEFFKKIKTILELSDDENNIRLIIGRRTLGEFYHEILPMLREVVEVTDTTSVRLQEYIPPKSEYTFYLDSSYGVLFCRVEATYGNKVHQITDTIKKSAFTETYRDYFGEKKVADVVMSYFPEVSEDLSEFICKDEELSLSVYRDGIDEFMKYGTVQCTDRFKARKIRTANDVKLGISLENDLLNLDIQSTDISKEELFEILQGYKIKKKYHVLKNGDFVDLQDESFQAILSLFEGCKVSPKELFQDKIHIPMYRALYVEKMLEENENLYAYRDRNFRRLVRDFRSISESDAEVPGSLQPVLRTYQEYGFKWLKTLALNDFSGILADEMGLGKTVQMISYLLSEKESKKEEEDCSLIIAPASLIYNWEAEIRRFAPSLHSIVIAGSKKEREDILTKKNQYDVMITSYDLLKRDIASYDGLSFSNAILDEAQYIKNAKAAVTKAVKIIKAKHRFALTGTPIENRLSELWSIFDFLMPGFLYEYEAFRTEFEAGIVKDKDEEVANRLKRMVQPFILRRLKTDVLKDLPEKLEEVYTAQMDKEQRMLYDAQVLKISKKLQDESDDDFKKSKIEILAELTRTRELCCDPSLLFEEYTGGSAKREACLELILNAISGEHKILLFSQFTSMLSLLEEDLKREGISYYKLTGSTKKEDRIEMMNAFNKDDTKVFLISLKAGGTGLNLTGADVVIHYDPWWNLAVQNQATDRAHRIGQEKPVTVYKLIIKDSIEEKIVKLQESKKDLADDILSGEGNSLTSLTKEDLLQLL